MSTEENKAIASQFDALEEAYDVDGMYDLMTSHKDSADPDILWRLAYAIMEKAKKVGGEDAKVKQPYITEARGHAKKALDLDDNNPKVLMMYCILLMEMAEYEGTKETVANAFTAKEYLLKALKLDPTSSDIMLCLGYWCFEISEMSWAERKAAGFLFSKPLTSSFEEALQYFEDAEKANPNFDISNDFMIAATLLKLKKDKDRAKDLLLKVANFEGKTFDDIQSREHAKEMLEEVFSIKL